MASYNRVLPVTPMRILISNDDGYRADGIVALRQALSSIADVEVVAPEHNNSAKSNALTLHTPLSVHSGGPGVRYVNGTPADCVHIALTGLLGYRPDLVVSGINNGANMGDDTLYSGTVGAAMEGYLFGIPSIAFSQVEKGWAHLDAAAESQSVIEVTYRPYLSTDLEGPQMDPPIHLVLTEVEADIFRVTGRARMLDVGNKAFPGISYTAKTFPGLTR